MNTVLNVWTKCVQLDESYIGHIFQANCRISWLASLKNYETGF